MNRLAACALLLCLAGCPRSGVEPDAASDVDAARADGGGTDGGDASRLDGAAPDAARLDGALPDAAPGEDASTDDAGLDAFVGEDTGVSVDAATADAFTATDAAVASDAGSDAGGSDAGTGDAGTSDAGTSACITPTAGQLVISEWMPDPSLVADASGEWFEVLATADVDLNGFSAGSSSLSVLVPAAGPCIHLMAGQRAVFARNTMSSANGMIPGTVVARFTFGLVNSTGTLMIGTGTTMLETVTWASSMAGRSIMFDTDHTQCNAPAGVALYNGTDTGTPNAINTPPECP